MTVAPEATAALIPELEKTPEEARNRTKARQSPRRRVKKREERDVRRVLEDDGRIAREAELFGGEEERAGEGLSSL
jgi:hypothetical protein